MTTDTINREIERSFEAPRESLYRAFTDPAQSTQWWGPRGTTHSHVEIDATQCGHYSDQMHLPDAGGGTRSVAGEGEYTAVSPYALAYTYRGRGEDHVTRVSVEFGETPEGSEVIVHHDGLPSTEFAEYNDSWNASLDRLEDLLAA